jgi:threonine dehydrogenase-like Zn-dependent dehydrogenase
VTTAVLAAPGEIQVRDMGLEEPGPGEVRVRLEGCGVCGSNLEPWVGKPWFDYPFEPGSPGHEGWGLVDAVGAAVEGLAVGDRVATLGDHAYATHQVIAADQVVPLPPALDGVPFPGEPLGCVMNIFERARITAGDRVAIVGIGFMGALLTQLAVAEGARVVGISRRPYSREIASSLGAEVTISTEDADAAVKRVEDWSGGDLCDVVIEATGKQGPLSLAARLARGRGRLVIAGYHQDGPREVDMQLWNWRGLDVINSHEREPERYLDGIRRAIDAALDGRLDPAPLITHSFPLQELSVALDHTRDRPAGFLKAVVTT